MISRYQSIDVKCSVSVKSLYIVLFLFSFVKIVVCVLFFFFFFSSRRRHTRSLRDWSSDVCSSDLPQVTVGGRLNRDVVVDELPSDRRAEQPVKLAEELLLPAGQEPPVELGRRRSEERRVGKECRSRWSPYQ